MKSCMCLVAISVLAGAGCSNNDGAPSNVPTMSFFVSSAKSVTGNLGGLRGADALCQNLAAGAGFGSKTWRAYLSVERDPDNNNRPADARDRIGTGPWQNANGIVIARDLGELHARTGNPELFIDERGQRIPGQWAGSPAGVEHDILTGSTSSGTLLAGMTCSDWTSGATTAVAQVGHSDGLGPGGNPTGALSSWNSSHANLNCADTAPRGGAGRIYCFARN